MNGHSFILFFWVLLITSCNDTIVTENTPENTFNSFWSIMDERYVYFEEKKINWDSIFTKYSNKAKQIRSDATLKIMLQEILDNWNDDHVSILIDNDEKIIISSKQRIKSPITYYAPIDKYSFGNYQVNTNQFYTIQNREKNYGYINFKDLNQIIPINIIESALENLRFDKGLIVDLRRCGGGYLNCTFRVAELFYTGKKALFFKQPKTNKGRNDFGKLQPIFHNGIGIIPMTTPIILLTDSIQYSAGNLLAFILNDMPNTISVGTSTTGGGGVVQFARLPNGWLMTYPSIKLFSTLGQNMEYGLKPDIFNSFSPSAFDISKRDEHIAIALGLLDSINGYEKVDYLEMYQ